MSLKAFDLISVLDKVETKIVCFEACGNKLFLGTEDGHVVSYSVEERTGGETDGTTYNAKMLAQVQLSTKHSVTCLGAASSVGRVLVLVDGTLHMLYHKTLATVSTVTRRTKGITTFCLNHNPTNPDPFALEVLVGRRRCVQLLLVQKDQVSVTLEVSCHEAPAVLALDGLWACVAAGGQYTLHNLQTDTNTTLFPYDAASVPLIRRIRKEEFLLAGPGGLGMFVTCEGVSIRPPINWADDVQAVTYHHPYILTVTPQFVRVYSVVDQQVKQTVRFSGGSLVGNFDGQVYLASPTSVYCLMPQPWHKQVQVLLGEQRVEEAVELCEQHGGPQHEHLVLTVLQRAGFLRMREEQYSTAADYFIRGKLDPRELLHLFSDVVPSAVGFVRAVPALHQIADLHSECDQHQLRRVTTFAVEYLLAHRSTGDTRYSLEVDTGIVKLLCRQGDREQLLEFLSTAGRVLCDVPECAVELTKEGMFIALQQLHSLTGSSEAAMAVLVRLLRQEVHDPQYPGPEYCRDVLLRTGNCDLILKYSTILLEADPRLGVSLFTDQRNNFKPQQILSLLDRFPAAKLVYLHHLVDDLGVREEKYHTELALQYAHQAVRLVALLEERGTGSTDNSTDNSTDTSTDTSKSLVSVRRRLQKILSSSLHYDAATVLACVRHSGILQQEKALLLGRLGEHEKALRLLVHEMGDFRAAEQYCGSHGGTAQQAPLYLLMLKAYLQPDGASTHKVDREVVTPLELLHNHSSALPLGPVLQLLPQHWTVAITRGYLRSALAHLHHQRRRALLQRGVAQCSMQQQEALLGRLRADAGPVRLTDGSVCSVCSDRVGGGGHVLYPNGVVAHLRCSTDVATCPLTGTCVANAFTINN